jgi:hypothetical protein
MMKKIISFSLLCSSASLFLGGCATSKTYELPSKNQFQGYKIIDAVEQDVVSIKVDRDEKIAIVVRDIGTTSYSYLEPRYMNSMITYEGLSSCCRPKDPLMGNSGLSVYKFSFIGLGETKIELIARHKGLLTTARHFDDDNTITVNVKVTK